MSEQATMMWQAVVFSDGGTTPCGITIGQPEVLPGFYPAAELAQAAAVAELNRRQELYSSAVRRVEVTRALPLSAPGFTTS